MARGSSAFWSSKLGQAAADFGVCLPKVDFEVGVARRFGGEAGLEGRRVAARWASGRAEAGQPASPRGSFAPRPLRLGAERGNLSLCVRVVPRVVGGIESAARASSPNGDLILVTE
jgi:hypothetical protein